MDVRKVTELLRATIDPAQQKQAEEQLKQVGQLIENVLGMTDTSTETCAFPLSFSFVTIHLLQYIINSLIKIQKNNIFFYYYSPDLTRYLILTVPLLLQE